MKYIKWSSTFAVLWVLGETNAATTKLSPIEKQAKIIGGEEKDIREVPFMVALSFHNFMCGGFLISPYYALTAYHCLHQIFNAVNENKARELLTVTIVARNKRNPNKYTQKDLDVEKIIPHPHYSRNGHFNDIAIIKIKPDHDWDDWHISYVGLPDGNGSRLKGRNAVSYGWGAEFTSSPTCSDSISYRAISSVFDVSKTLKEIKLPIVDRSSCQRKLENALPCAFEIKDTQMCAGGAPNKDTCKGDSGGPLIKYESANKNPIAIGIVSYGYGCGSGLPAVYTKVSKYTKWIRQVIAS